MGHSCWKFPGFLNVKHQELVTLGFSWGSKGGKAVPSFTSSCWWISLTQCLMVTPSCIYGSEAAHPLFPCLSYS